MKEKKKDKKEAATQVSDVDFMKQALSLAQARRFRDAAPLFEAYALRHDPDDASGFGVPVLAAAKAWLQAEAPERALDLSHRLHELFVSRGDVQRALSLAHKFVDMFREFGFREIAERRASEAAEAFGDRWIDPGAARLPTHCNQCGAPLRPDQLVRPTPASCACPYCGAPVG